MLTGNKVGISFRTAQFLHKKYKQAELEINTYIFMKAAKINSVRIYKQIQDADLVVVRFGDKYKQWNAAFEAGYAIAIGIPVITLHGEELNHALKEIDAAARATAETPEQVVEILKYLLTQK